MARPIEWTPEEKNKATDKIFFRIATGESVRKILADDKEKLPSRKLFYEWMAEDKELCDHYVKVMEIRTDEIADEMMDIADNLGEDVITTNDGREIVNHGVINRDRLRVDTRKWLLAKLHPKKYGERTILAGDKENPLIPPRTLTKEEAKELWKDFEDGKFPKVQQ